MKKVIFISALAIAAAVSCTKSDIVDTKFNEQISFETYAGRAAQTKVGAATVDTLKLSDYKGIGVYGFYTGKDDYEANSSKANLWSNQRLYWGVLPNAETGTPNGWVYADTKYWANDDDKYTFLAYAPFDSEISTTVGTINPTITYEVPQDLAEQQDVLYAKATGTAATLKTGVVLDMKHALARLTVTAYSSDQNGFQYDIKNVTISGKFNTKGTLTLAAADATTQTGWTPIPEVATDTESYEFYNDDAVAKKADGTFDALPSTSEAAINYAKVGDKYCNYLMMIPTEFTATNTANLSVTYTTIYEGQESTPVTKSIPVVMDFEMGKAYAINLNFSHDVQPITFDVTVSTWDEGTVVEGKNPQHQDSDVEA